MLEIVGKPVAVNPDAALRALAIEREWPVLDFEKPQSMRSRDRAKVAAAGSAASAAAVALGLAWYARWHRSR